MTQPSPASDLADARLRDLGGHRLVPQLVFAGALLTALFTAALLMTAFVVTSETGTRALSMDFRVFWAAARLALEGRFLAPFDLATLGAVHGVDTDQWMPWLYPPGYLLLIAPFGVPSFAVSYAVMTALSLAAMAWAVRCFAGGSPSVWLAMVLAPAYLPALLIGQNSVIWFAVLLGALAALRADRAVLAGVLIGCLTLKPQLGLMIPVALLAAGQWRVILVAAGTAAAWLALPTLVTGLGYWPLFFDRLSEQGDRLVAQIATLELMVGPYALISRLGAPPPLALAVQGGLVLMSASAVALLWRARRVGFDAKAAALLTAIFLSAPYLWYYEAALMPLVGLFLWRAGLVRPGLPGYLLLLLLWLGAGVQAMNIFVDLGADDFPWAMILTPVMFLCLGLCLAQLRAPHPQPSGPS
jgi:hypothetical protein